MAGLWLIGFKETRMRTILLYLNLIFNYSIDFNAWLPTMVCSLI